MLLKKLIKWLVFFWVCLIPATIIPALLPIVSILGIAGAIVIIHKHNKWISERALDFNIKPYQFKKYLKSAIKFKDEEVMMGFSNAMNSSGIGFSWTPNWE